MIASNRDRRRTALLAVASIVLVACGYTEEEMQIKRDRIDSLGRSLDETEARSLAFMKKCMDENHRLNALLDQRSSGGESVAAEPAPPPAGRLVARFTGRGISTTRPFTTDGPWEVRWAVSGTDADALFVITAYTAAGELGGILASQSDDGSGSSYVPRGGSYLLNVNSIGSWAINIVSLQ